MIDSKEAHHIGTLVEQFRTLKAAHTLEAAPERSAPRKAATIAEPVTTRLLNRTGALSSPQAESDISDGKSPTAADPSGIPAETEPDSPAHTPELLFPTPLPAPRKPKVSHTKRLTRDKRQMSLF